MIGLKYAKKIYPFGYVIGFKDMMSLLILTTVVLGILLAKIVG